MFAANLGGHLTYLENRLDAALYDVLEAVGHAMSHLGLLVILNLMATQPLTIRGWADSCLDILSCFTCQNTRKLALAPTP